MASITAYFDASGSPDSEAVSIGGLISSTEKWISFSGRWQEILDAFEVSSLHMKHYAHSEGEFVSWRWDEPRRRRFLSALLKVIEDHVEYAVASTVLMRDYRAVDKEYLLNGFMRPYTFAASTCVGAIGPWARGVSYDPDGISYIFEKGDTDQGDLSKCWERLFPQMRINPVFYKKRDRHPNPDVCPPIRPFEAADLIAYENHKGNVALKGKDSVFLDELRQPLQRLLTNLPGAKAWLYSRASEMEAVCSLWGVRKR
jgi:hypothetical protein